MTALRKQNPKKAKSDIFTMNNEKMNRHIAEWYETHTQQVRDLMHDLWLHPELALKEYHACQTVAQFAQAHGFRDIETYAAEDWGNAEVKPNTVIASWGSGHPVIGIVGELDALPNLGQDLCPDKKTIPGPGHGCGHNLMGGGAAGAACALRYAMEKEGLSGTVRLIEAPAEEIGMGKAYLAKNGVFSDLDVALMWHPMRGPLDFSPVEQQVGFRVKFEFHGVAVHAAGEPWNGRSALDAVQLMNMGCEFLREHKKPITWIHYCITDGGSAPNIVPDYAASMYQFRSMDDYAAAEELFQRALKVAEGAALMTGTTMEYKLLSVIPQFYYNLPLCRHMAETAAKVPPLSYTQEELALAREHYRCLLGKEASEDDTEVMPTGCLPFRTTKLNSNCTDAADMTYFCPTIHCQGMGRLQDSSGHTWSTTFILGCALGEKAGVYAYEIIAQAGYEILKNPKLSDEFWKAYREMNIPPHKDWI